jgi:hypothetical protein
VEEQDDYGYQRKNLIVFKIDPENELQDQIKESAKRILAKKRKTLLDIDNKKKVPDTEKYSNMMSIVKEELLKSIILV